MRKNQVDLILIEQSKRRNVIISFVCSIIVITILSIFLLITYYDKRKNNYVTYDESSNISYKVYLKENDFFENEYLGTNKQYIANLINYITADFEYNLSFNTDNVEYKYEYRIDANVNVYDEETNNILFSKSENLIPRQEYTTSEKQVSIRKSINIDYNYYNYLINRFISMYDLDDSKSMLTINMYINTIGSCDDFVENERNESVITLSIPLTTKTVAIEISNDLIDTENNVMLCETDKIDYILLISGIVALGLDVGVIVCLIRYELKTRTADTIYIKKLKKILNNYGSYIQEMAEDFDLKGYQLIKIKTFENLLEIRDTIKQPILMKQNKERTSSYFIVPSNTKQLYIYRLKLEDIRIDSII